MLPQCCRGLAALSRWVHGNLENHHVGLLAGNFGRVCVRWRLDCCVCGGFGRSELANPKLPLDGVGMSSEVSWTILVIVLLVVSVGVAGYVQLAR